MDPAMNGMQSPDGQVESTITHTADIAAEGQVREQLEQARRLLRASADSMLDPQVLFEAVRDSCGQVVDFRYVSVNRATCLYLQVDEEHILGSSALENHPNLGGAGLLARFVQCLEDGQPVILTDFAYFNEMLDDARRYDIRATRAGRELLSLCWTDVTDRFQAAQRLAASEERYRLLAENASDAVFHGRDGRFVWASPSVEDVLGAPPDYWVGRDVRDIVPPEERTASAERMAILEAGGSIQRRAQVLAADGTAHWTHVHSRPFYDANGRQDGFTAALRLIDAEVAAENVAAEASRLRARADALYRRSMDSSAVGIAQVDAEGRFIEVNDALCTFYGYDAETLKTKTWQELTAEDYLQADLDSVADVMAGRIDSYRMVKQYIHADGHRIWGDLSVGCVRADDGEVEILITQVNDITAEVESRRQLERALDRQAAVMASAAVGMALTLPGGGILEVNSAICDFFGYDAETLLQKSWMELTDPEYLGESLAVIADLVAGRIDSYRITKRYIHADGHPIWGDLAVGCVRTPDGGVENLVCQIVDITDEVEAREQLEQARRRQAENDARYRALIEKSTIATKLIAPDGRFLMANQAMCDLIGYDADTLQCMTWRDITAPEDRMKQQTLFADLMDGRRDTFRTDKRYLHADGHVIWADLSASCLRRPDGELESVIAQIVDITATVTSREQLARREEQNRALAQSLQAELDGAAHYLKSVLPDDLAGGVSISSRYLPSHTLGGDSFDFFWIDDDHLIVYLLDVSGHGVKAALVAISVHNILRSTSLSTTTLLDPEQVLTKLNDQFAMDRHDGNYFTIWYSVYQPSTGTLRYASAGHPPALLFTAGELALLRNHSLPVGMFDDADFTTITVPVPPGGQILVYSDGAYELPLADGAQWTLDDFVKLCAGLAESPDWRLDDLIESLRRLCATNSFEDDCSVLLVSFD
jgi:PAS domain S-box-containing protein